jgi:hypothetical protein
VAKAGEVVFKILEHFAMRMPVPTPAPRCASAQLVDAHAPFVILPAG